MAHIVVENPILNSPFRKPNRPIRFDDDGIKNDIVSACRISSYFVPIPQPRAKGRQLCFKTE